MNQSNRRTMTQKRNETIWQAERGDELVVKGHHLGEPEREGEILEVLGDFGRPPYEVRWDDGTVTRLYPGSDAFVRHLVGGHNAASEDA
jgi:uncharacterized protein DUF1918